ncbi:unnamed protein product [Rotaria socialis]
MIGIYLNRLLDITMRSAYNKLCENAVIRGSLLNEHTLISKMIDSLMLRKYAKVIMKDFDVFRERVQNVNASRQGDDDLQMTIFRPLHIERMENLSILFADIVGFTHMSSNKSASQLVSLLSDLYGRFDDLCVQMSCEKIATLGDCCYCVSGCPEPREEHARSCVLMGLTMLNAIEEFDQDNSEYVDMRVGVHSVHGTRISRQSCTLFLAIVLIHEITHAVKYFSKKQTTTPELQFFSTYSSPDEHDGGNALEHELLSGEIHTLVEHLVSKIWESWDRFQKDLIWISFKFQKGFQKISRSFYSGFKKISFGFKMDLIWISKTFQKDLIWISKTFQKDFIWI